MGSIGQPIADHSVEGESGKDPPYPAASTSLVHDPGGYIVWQWEVLS